MQRVSIRTRHFCRVMLSQVLVGATGERFVSIRTRHFCRVMRKSDGTVRYTIGFQSAPGISAG